MFQAKLRLSSDFLIDQVDPRVFGGFLEHMGRAVYQGVFDPESPLADTDGFRTDVVDALRRLRFTAMRYPGGNFASAYRWQDGVGPVEDRPTVRELAWNSVEPNTFGTHEFMKLCDLLGWTPMVTVNLGTGTPQDARDWLEYANGRPGTKWADLRVQNGEPDPFDVKLWCLGNEMDGPWQIGHCSAEEYASRANQTAALMKKLDPSIELVVCGSCFPGLPTFPEWDRTVLEACWDNVEHISLHRYLGNRADDTEAFLATPIAVDRQIEQVDAVCRYVQALKRSKKRITLSFDEYNVWYRTQNDEGTDGKGQFAPPLIEEPYNLEDALVIAGILCSFVRHADAVKVANIAQIVNVIAPILTKGDEMVLQTIFFALEMFAERREGAAMRTAVSAPNVKDAPAVDAAAILGEGCLHLFLINRSVEDECELDLHTDFGLKGLRSAEVLTGADPKAGNTFESPNTIGSQTFDQVSLGDKTSVVLPAMAFAALTFDLD